MEINELLSLIKSKGCRITDSRKTILEVLYANRTILLSVDKLHQLASAINPSINTTTIYRNLQLLEDLSLLYIKEDGGLSLYKLVCHDHHHHHIICLNCSKMVPIDYCPIRPALESLVAKEGFHLVDHHMELYGYCPDCRRV